jgi:hypothetical protein
MDRDDAGMSDRSDEAQHGDTGMIGSESEDPGPGRDTSLTDPDPVAASTDQPRGTVAMSEGDPMRTRLGSHVEGAGVIGYDVAASEEGAATQETPAEDRPGYDPERPAGETAAAWAGPTAADHDPALAEPVVDQGAYERDPGTPGDPAVGHGSYTPGLAAEPVVDQGAYEGAPESDAPATYTGEEEDVTGRPEYADRAEGGDDQDLYQQEAQRADRPGGGGSLFTDDEPERLDRPGPQEPGVQEGIYDQEADQARRQRPSDGV